jgi:predicted metal-dependent peptidase
MGAAPERKIPMSELSARLKLESCIKVMLAYSPILGYLLQEVDRISDSGCSTMGVGFIDKEARIGLYYSPTFINLMPEELLIKVILPHEMAHIICGHLGRYKTDDYKDLSLQFLNLGMDMAVNCENYIQMKLASKADTTIRKLLEKEKTKMLEAMKSGNAPKEAIEEFEKKSTEGAGLVTADKYKLPFKQTTDYYLVELLKKYKKQQEAGGASGDSGGVPIFNGFDEHKFNNSNLSQTTQQNLAKSTLGQAYKEWVNHGKQRGHTPNGAIENIEEMLFPKMPITKAFRNIIGSFIGSDFNPSSSRINKRQNSYTSPGKRIKEKLQLCIVFDTSGSMSKDDLKLARGLVKRVQREMDPEIFIIHCDAEVAHTETIRGKQIPIKFHGRGGTDFTPVYEWLYKKGMKPDGVIFFTDGHGALNTDKAGRYRTLWAITPSGTTYDFMRGQRMRILKLGDCANE